MVEKKRTSRTTKSEEVQLPAVEEVPAVEETVDPVQEQKEAAADEQEYTPRVGTRVKVTGLVNTVYLRAGDVVHVDTTEQLLDLAARGLVRLERNG